MVRTCSVTIYYKNPIERLMLPHRKWDHFQKINKHQRKLYANWKFSVRAFDKLPTALSMQFTLI